MTRKGPRDACQASQKTGLREEERGADKTGEYDAVLAEFVKPEGKCVAGAAGGIGSAGVPRRAVSTAGEATRSNGTAPNSF
jgi:hypothetical protein